jgi:hypothetical protein
MKLNELIRRLENVRMAMDCGNVEVVIYMSGGKCTLVFLRGTERCFGMVSNVVYEKECENVGGGEAVIIDSYEENNYK